jgi:V8-like Glu-specific endopeptidase
MKQQYTVAGQVIELEAIPNMLGVRFKEPALYSTRAAAVRRPEFGEFEERFEVPNEKFTVFKIASTLQAPEERFDSAVDAVVNQELVERVSPVFAVGDAYTMATDRLLVGFKSARAANKILKDIGEILHEEDNEYVVEISPNENPFDLVAKLIEYDEVEYAEPDFVTFGAHLARYYYKDTADSKDTFVPQAPTESDPLADQQYAIRITMAEEAWRLQRGKPSIRIAILDEGVDTRHEDLSAAIVGNYDGVDNDEFQEPRDWDAHGTACSGLAASIHDNQKGVKGIGGGCSILAVRIAYSAYRGADWTTRNSWIKRAIDWSWKNGADVLSNSWGGGAPSAAIANAFTRARTHGRGEKGAVVVIAAGNANSLHDFPGNLDDVLTVSASNEYDEPKTPTSRDGETWWGSNYGPKIDVAAPGVHNYTTDNSGSNGYNRTPGSGGNYVHNFNGTSSSTPIVAGAVGLVLSANPDLKEDEVREIIRNTADKVGPVPYNNDGRNDRMGHGRLNVLRAVKAAMETDGRVIPTGKHSPVSNTHGNSESEVTVLAETEPTTGTAKSSKAETADGMESAPAAAATRQIAAKAIAPDIEGLDDIAIASYGYLPPAPETVHGRDDRRRISNTDSYPWRVTSSLLITARDNSRWIGTGWFIGPNTLVTAGHVVFIYDPSKTERHGWVKRIEVMPGRNESELPYGMAISEIFHSVTGWTEGGHDEYDYGAIKISSNLGDVVGTFGFGVLGSSELFRTRGNLAGYPSDKPRGTLWYDNNRIASVTTRKVYYDIDTAGGQSGAAIYRIKSGKRTAFGVHAYGGARTNSATRITTPVFQNLTNWNEG